MGELKTEDNGASGLETRVFSSILYRMGKVLQL